MLATCFSTLSCLAALLPLAAQAFTNCPLIGPDFSAPTKLSSSQNFQSAVTNLTQLMQQTVSSSNSSYGPFDSTNTSFSLEIFSTHEPGSLYTKHYAAPALAATQQGVKNVTSDTTYRIGSLTKLFSVYTFLIESGDVKFNEPITKYIPELLEATEALNATQNPVDYVAWEDVTIGELASQMADIGRDFAGFGELDGLANVDGVAAGLPPLNASETAACYGGGYCTRAQFFAGFTERHPVYAPATAPIYSNAAYQILSYALENITGVDFPTMVENSLFKPLNLSAGTSWTLPASNSNGIIPEGAAWTVDLGDETAAGGMYATSSDSVLIGRSILTSSLLKPIQTRRWLKPHGFVSDIFSAVGAPWEIRRIQTAPNSRIVDLYTKAGDLPGYASFLLLVPDWDVGFIILAAGTYPTSSPDANVAVLADIIADTLFPAMEATAREEADAAFSGNYASSDPNLNSSLTITTDPTLPGLGVRSWISNNTDILASPLAGPSIRLYPTGLKTVLASGDTEMGYRAVFENPSAGTIGGVFSSGCQTWTVVDQEYWGAVGMDEFLITVGCDGVAKSVEPRVARVVLERVS